MNDTGEHPGERRVPPEVQIAAPLWPPRLDAGGARALLRVLLKAGRAQAALPVHVDVDVEDLAS